MSKALSDLKRYPHDARELLLAWDRADELLRLEIDALDFSGKRILVMNDAFGAIATHFETQGTAKGQDLTGNKVLSGDQDFKQEHHLTEAQELTIYTDSFLSDQAIRLNSNGKISPIHCLQDLHGIYDFVFYRFPKNLSFFEDELCELSAHLAPHSRLIGTSMVKHLPSGAFKLLKQYIGKTTTSLAQKKARLVFANFEKSSVKTPYPLQVQIENFKTPFLNASNLFSREKLDIGTRVFLEHVPSGPYSRILDLGCANGIVGIQAKLKNPDAKIIFSDESFMAIESAKQNYRNYFNDEADFVWTNCYQNQENQSLDLVLCNPPFHQQMLQEDRIALQMFKDAHSALKRGGIMRVIGNGHLQYPQLLKKIYGNSTVIGTHPKFVVTEVVKR